MNMTHTEKPSDNYSRLVAPQVVEKKTTFNKHHLGEEGTILFWLVLNTE